MGRYDHIHVTLAQGARDLLKAEKVAQLSSFASSHWSCSGRLLATSWAQDLERFSFPSVEDLGPLVGVCGIKLTHSVRAGVENMDNIGSAARTALTNFSGHWLLAGTTGWEDAILVCWSHSFGEISRAASSLRQLRLESIAGCDKLRGVHAVLTTCTATGLEMPPGFLDADNSLLAEGWLHRVLPRMDNNSRLDWVCRFELRPGHLDAFEQDLTARLSKALPSVSHYFGKTFGQYDLSASFQGGSHSDWAKFVVAVALPLATSPGTLVRAMETQPQIKLCDEDRAQVSEGKARAAILRKAESPSEKLQTEVTIIKDRCAAAGIPQHTIDSLSAIRSRIASLGDDDLLKGTLGTVERVFGSFADGLEAWNGLVGERQLIEWLHCVERCLADRYRGTYPIGDSPVPRLGNYQASHHAFLHAADFLAQAACDAALSQFNQLAAKQNLTTLPKPAICCHIGNSPTPFALSILKPMRCGFIDVPSTMVFQLRGLSLLMHETGHIVENTYFSCFHRFTSLSGEGAADTSREARIETQIKEILAELFSLVFCFRGDAEKHAECMLKLLEEYLPEDPILAASSLFTYHFRLQAAASLLAGDWSGSPRVTIGKEFFDKMWRLAETDDEQARTELTNIGEALARLQFAVDTKPSFQCFLLSLGSLTKDDILRKHVGGSELVELREFMTRKARCAAGLEQENLAQDFIFLERLGSAGLVV